MNIDIILVMASLSLGVCLGVFIEFVTNVRRLEHKVETVRDERDNYKTTVQDMTVSVRKMSKEIAVIENDNLTLRDRMSDYNNLLDKIQALRCCENCNHGKLCNNDCTLSMRESCYNKNTAMVHWES